MDGVGKGKARQRESKMMDGRTVFPPIDIQHWTKSLNFYQGLHRSNLK